MDQQISDDFDMNQQNDDLDEQEDEFSTARVHVRGMGPTTENYSVYQRNDSVVLPQQPPEAPPNFNPQEFIFPPDHFQNMQWTSVDQIKQYLDRGIQKLNLGFTNRMYLQRTQFGHLLYKCKICHSRITFSKPQNYKIIRFQNRHNHEHKQIMERNQQHNIYSYLIEIPFEQGIFLNTEVRYMIKNKFDITKEKAKVISDRFLKNYMDLDFILEKIARETKCIFKKFYNESEKQTSAVLMVNPQMRKRYQKYGKNDCICIDLKKRILTNVNQNGKIWQILLFYGQDNDLNIIFFGLCLISDRTTDMYTSIIQCFFKLIQENNLCQQSHNIYPQTIITKEVPGLTQAIQIACNKIPQSNRWVHLFDWRAKLKKIRQHLKSKKFTDDETGMLLGWFGQLLSVPTQIRFQEILSQNRLHKIDQQLVNELIQKKSKYCLSAFPLRFCGFCPATKRNDAYNQIIRKNFKPGKNFSKFFYQFLKYERQQPSMMQQSDSRKNVIKQNMYPELNSIQLRLHANIFAKLLQNFTQTIDLDSIKLSQIHYKVVHSSHTQQLHLIQGTNIWVCSCHYQQKVGIPCMHQLKLIGQYPYLIQKHIHQRWLLKGSEVKREDKIKIEPTMMNQEPQRDQGSVYVKKQYLEDYKVVDSLYLKSRSSIRK